MNVARTDLPLLHGISMDELDRLPKTCHVIAGGQTIGNSERKSIVGFIKEEFAKIVQPAR